MKEGDETKDGREEMNEVGVKVVGSAFRNGIHAWPRYN